MSAGRDGGGWTHARRGFANVVKLDPGDPVASPIAAMINQLFAVDRGARENGSQSGSVSPLTSTERS
jgi:hypothetical protein